MSLFGELIDDDSAQTTAEYALVILGAAAVATALIMWVKDSGAVGRFFGKIFDTLMNGL